MKFQIFLTHFLESLLTITSPRAIIDILADVSCSRSRRVAHAKAALNLVVVIVRALVAGVYDCWVRSLSILYNQKGNDVREIRSQAVDFL